MEQQTPIIELYVTRTFSEKLTAAFSFLRENWRTLLKYVTYFMLPAALVLGFFVNHFWGGYFNLLDGQFDDQVFIRFAMTTGVTIVVAAVVYVVFLAVLFALLRLYYSRPERLQDLQADELMPEFYACLKRAAVFVLTIGLIIVAVIGLMGLLVGGGMAVHPAVGVIVLLLLYAALAALAIPLTLSEPIYMMEDGISIFAAYRKALRLGFATWGGIFAISFVFSILTSILQSFTMAPWYVLFFIKAIFTASSTLDGSFVNTIFFTMMEYLACVLQVSGYLLSAVITTVGILIQYGHACDKVDGVGVAKNIEHFDEFDNF